MRAFLDALLRSEMLRALLPLLASVHASQDSLPLEKQAFARRHGSWDALDAPEAPALRDTYGPSKAHMRDTCII